LINLSKLLIVVLILYLINKSGFLVLSLIFFSLLLVSFFTTVNAFKLLYKLRFFFLSFIVIFPLVIPGEIIADLNIVKISREGINISIHHILRLFNLFLIAKFYTSYVSSKDIIKALIYFVYPFKFFGLNIESLYQILFLTLNYIENLDFEKFDKQKPIISLKKILYNKKIIPFDVQNYVIEIEYKNYLLIILFLILLFSL
jgi:hypothetical protein